MSSESVGPVHVSTRSVGKLAPDLGLLILLASFLGSVIYLSYRGELSTDPTPLYVFFAFMMVATAFGIRGYLKTRTIEFYGDHVRVLGYNQDGQDSMDAPYSAIDVRGRSKASVFLLSINAVPSKSWKVSNKGVKTSAGTVPLYAWIKEKREFSGAAARQAPQP